MNLIDAILYSIKKNPHDFEAYEDCFSAIKNTENEDFKLSHGKCNDLKACLIRELEDTKEFDKFFNLYRRVLLYDAPHNFDSFMLYLEIDREPEKRFYQPRRNILKQVADALQEFVEGDLDELFLSMPPRVGKSTILMFFTLWWMGRNTESSNLYVSYTGIVVKVFYNGILEVLDDPKTYNYHQIFPKARKEVTDAGDLLLDLERKKRYKSLTCRSIDGTLNGACDCSGILIADDLVSDIEEALNTQRLQTKWNAVENNMLPRAKEQAKILWCGTRWSINDPIGRRLDLLESDETYADVNYKVIAIPALNENDESNFDYLFNLGFSTAYYRRRRASFEKSNDIASWDAQYLQKPIEREGSLFLPSNLRYYNGVLPESEPDRIFMALDPAYGGGDFVSAPVAVQYGEDLYIPDLVFNDSDKTITQPRVVQTVMGNSVAALTMEADASTEGYKDKIEEKLSELGYKLNIVTKAPPRNKSKRDRIFNAAPDIIEHMIFLETSKRGKEYQKFMENLFSFKMQAKKQHDDAPDSLAMLISMSEFTNYVKPMRRPF